jgi:hypothetical protein
MPFQFFNNGIPYELGSVGKTGFLDARLQPQNELVTRGNRD